MATCNLASKDLCVSATVVTHFVDINRMSTSNVWTSRWKRINEAISQQFANVTIKSDKQNQKTAFPMKITNAEYERGGGLLGELRNIENVCVKWFNIFIDAYDYKLAIIYCM